MRDLERWTDQQLSDFSLKLEDYHRVFGVFWTMASVSFTEDATYCPTAIVYLKGRPRIVVNKGFWNLLTDRDHVFVIVHECLHAMLNHGIRNGRDLFPNATPAQVNQAQDITINEMAESLFGLQRTDLTDWEKYCWISTCFPGDPTVLPNETFVYYLEKLTKGGPRPLLLVDIHGGVEDGEEEEDDDGVLDDLFDTLTPEELDAMMKAVGSRGAGNKGLAGYIARQESKKKLSVRNLIKGMKTAVTKAQPVDTFVTQNRRYTAMPDDMILPNAHNSKKGQDKFHVVLCLDVSGSVEHLRGMFYELRELFLREKDYLEVRSYVFADEIAEITKRDQAYNVGGGNAPFQIIENELMKLDPRTKRPRRYPDSVIVITDGIAKGVRPKFPKRWVWLLTDYHELESIPKASRTYLIKDVVFD